MLKVEGKKAHINWIHTFNTYTDEIEKLTNVWEYASSQCYMLLSDNELNFVFSQKYSTHDVEANRPKEKNMSVQTTQ